MPLTPEDVRNKRFTPVRLREGYDMGEVDQFLDEVESELERLTQENNDLRTKLARASSSRPPEDTQAMRAPEPPRPVLEERKPLPPPRIEAPPPMPAMSQQRHAPESVADASGAAARLLEIAAKNAEEIEADAKDQADKILAEARMKAERLTNESRAKADRMESDARARAQKLDAETAERRQQLFGDLERDRDRLSREVEHLRSFEREYRSRLKNYFQAQLAQLEGEETVAAPLPGPDSEHSPKRLRSLLGEDDRQQR
ncbi:MAG TPA: DivIVA domain-containing protein [Nocardioidaceae bacterium]|jgi:DivIVA domain-containing protein|nr:DivIVA domain-containing protein [Nocardioidaceae bacterium]